MLLSMSQPVLRIAGESYLRRMWSVAEKAVLTITYIWLASDE